MELGRQVINVHDVPGRLLAFFFCVCDLKGPGRWGKTSVNMSFFRDLIGIIMKIMDLFMGVGNYSSNRVF